MPDALSSHQTLGPCVSAIDSAGECCSLCSTTLGCTAWTFWKSELVGRKSGVVNRATLVGKLAKKSSKCCMRRWKPLGKFPDSDAISGLVLRPCTVNCSLPHFDDTNFPWPIAGDGSGVVMRGSMDEIPWMKLLHRPRAAHSQSPPEPPLSLNGSLQPTRTGQPPRIAVCMAGQARTFGHPAIWRSALENLLAGRHDLYAVLGMGSEGCPRGCPDRRTAASGMSLQSFNDMELAAPCQLERALRALRPVRVRLVLEVKGGGTKDHLPYSATPHHTAPQHTTSTPHHTTPHHTTPPHHD